MKLQQTTHRELSIVDLFEKYFDERKKNIVVNLEGNKSLSENIDVICKKQGVSFVKICDKALKFAYNSKYGNWDKVNDLRSIYKNNWFDPIFKYFQNISSATKIIDIGCNDARELKDILGDNFLVPKITLLDISNKALKKIENIAFANLQTINESFSSTTISENSYDFCLSFRTLHSSGIDMDKGVKKCFAITKPGGTIIISVSNGYIDEYTNKPIVGMYDYKSGLVNIEMPNTIAKHIENSLLLLSAQDVSVIKGNTEIFIIAKK